jgi:hypothetical protein
MLKLSGLALKKNDILSWYGHYNLLRNLQRMYTNGVLKDT